MRCVRSRGTWSALIVLSLVCVSCGTRIPEVRDTSDSVICDASRRDDCVSVTLGFVEGRVDDLARIIQLQQALKACQERGP